MKNVLATTLALAIGVVVSSAGSQVPTSASPAAVQRSGDDTAVQEIVRMVERFYNEGDSEALGQLYAEDADRRDSAGRHAKGLREVKEMYEGIFRSRQPRRNGPDNQTRFDGEVRFIRSDVALVDGFYTLADRRRGPYTLVVTKANGRWLIAAGRAGAVIQ